jgi:hypothetical protein
MHDHSRGLLKNMIKPSYTYQVYCEQKHEYLIDPEADLSVVYLSAD